MTANAIRVIHPYWDNGSLVFDDPDVGLRKEPFVAGADSVLEVLAAQIPGCKERFTLLFSDNPFPGAQALIRRLRPEYGGTWYACDALAGAEGWLCPALFKYFEEAPEHLYLQIKPQRP
jgi:hypothetical protein